MNDNSAQQTVCNAKFIRKDDRTVHLQLDIDDSLGVSDKT